MSLDADALRAVLDGDEAHHPLVVLWAARTHQDLGYAAHLALSYVGVWARPSSIGRTDQYERARLSLITYMTGSTLNLRTRELYDLRDLRAAINFEETQWSR